MISFTGATAGIARMSAADEAKPSPGQRSVHCPTCRSVAAWDGNPHRPFCSFRCRLIDLGRWLDERYRVAAEDLPDDGEPPDLPEGPPRVP